MLGLAFALCHPVLSAEARVALTLRLLGGLTTAEIAHAFLTAEPAMAQRITRPKRTLAAARVEIAVPPQPDLRPRLASVLIDRRLPRAGRPGAGHRLGAHRGAP